MRSTQIIDKNSKYVVSAAEMKRCDSCTIEHFGVPQMVLMERAALSLCDQIKAVASKNARVVIFAGSGNNGGDGIAAARLLHQDSIEVVLVIVNHKKGRLTDACRDQLEIATKYGVKVADFDDFKEKYDLKGYDIAVDAMLGIGCSRPLEGEYLDATELINSAAKHEKGTRPVVVAADIPTGINADDGSICGSCVHADYTVTFGFIKLGLLMFPGNQYCGEIALRQVGITEDGFRGDLPKCRYIDADDTTNAAAVLLPDRNPAGNKGTFGKVLIVAGSKNVSGACTMAAESALKSGAGMVRVFTEMNNLHAVQTLIPEAMYDIYKDCSGEDVSNQADIRENQFAENSREEENRNQSNEMESQKEADALADGVKPWVVSLEEKLRNAISWADTIVCGPGIGTGDTGKLIVRTVLECDDPDMNLVLDADAINIIAADDDMKQQLRDFRGAKILTPHMAEFARLSGRSVVECKAGKLSLPAELAKDFHGSIICKDARSVVTDGDNIFINISGNDGMATAGSGDVLAGLLGAVMSIKEFSAFEAAVIGCYLHGAAGDVAAGLHGRTTMTARDISEGLKTIL
jgi:NAD(P)H-hydrate epimerase